MKIALAQLDVHIGNFADNTRKHIEIIRKAKTSGVDLVVFPELSVTGYPARDFFEFTEFLALSNQAIQEIASVCDGIAAIVGAPFINPELEGKSLFNAAFFLENGVIKQVVRKTLLPTYDVFDEYRYFEPNKEFRCIDFQDKKIALVICEDSWDIEDDPLYNIKPLDELVKDSPDFIINISASPFSYNHPENRRKMLKKNADRYNLPMIYVNHVGAHTELIFDGGSMAINAKGEAILEMAHFEEDYQELDLSDFSGKPVEIPTRSKAENIHDALVCGIRGYFWKLGFKQAILGLSGGIDSAVTAVLAVEALGKENVRGILMPSQYSSDHSVKDAITLAENLGIAYDILPIQSIYESFDASLQPFYAGKPADVTEENIQARTRGVLLMALANKFGYVLLNTSNKSEAAVGYGTLYGDMCGGISVLGDVYKTEVYALTAYINRAQEIIPQHTIVKPPSAELRPNQKDSDSLPEYAILDALLFQYIEGKKGPEELVKMGFDTQLVKKVLRLVNINEYKRYQTPPILRVSPKAFGQGRRMPIVGKYLS